MLRPFLALTTLAVLACDPAPTSPAPETVAADAPPATVLAEASNAEVGNWLARLQAELAQYHRFEVAEDGDYDTPLTGCMESAEGGMGYHYAAMPFDDQIDDVRPEALIYEPQKNGRMRLVGVEYIVPFSETWPYPGTAPMLHGRSFSANLGFGVWALHAWVWRHNPEGMFKDWNPNVNCDYAN